MSALRERDGATPEPTAVVAALERKGGAASKRGEIGLVRCSVALSSLLFLVFIALALQALWGQGWAVAPFVLMIGGLFYCALSYQIIRLGAAERRARAAAPILPPEALLSEGAPTVTVLIPSYQESRRVLIGTVLSAVLATYRNKRIVVLLDDPPHKPEPLAESLGAIADLRHWLEEVSAIRDAALAGAPDALRYALAHERFAGWLREMVVRLEAEADPAFVHVERFVIEQVVSPQIRAHEAAALALRQNREGDLEGARDRLASSFVGEIVTFQRKRFVNLSHSANKAMNLNAYLGLMGRDFAIVNTEAGAELQPLPSGATQADLSVPMSDYVLTLDADSVILDDYLLKLVGILELNPDAAVAQTPYLTFPNGVTPVERVAGATTDIQYLIHQGSSYYRAAYWVGANAIIRRRAFEDIRTTRFENGYEVSVFVQDKTVIEDTGSTLDLLDKGWHVHNHFEPLAYSATPADFGALAIQRKRWANGGLILFFDLLRCHVRQGGAWRNLAQLFIRSHYLLSPLIGNLGILLLMVVPSAKAHPIFWAALFMVPYFLLYMADLRHMGYRRRNLFGVSALNLMLLPVNLAGVLASIWQLMGGRRRTFSRTPKVAKRTAIPVYAFVFNLAILALMIVYTVQALRGEQFNGIWLPLLNIVLYSYGLTRFIGLSVGFCDLWHSLQARSLEGGQRLLAPLRRILPRLGLAPAAPSLLSADLPHGRRLASPSQTSEDDR